MSLAAGRVVRQMLMKASGSMPDQTGLVAAVFSMPDSSIGTAPSHRRVVDDGMGVGANAEWRNDSGDRRAR
jgi:hypothetical protein